MTAPANTLRRLRQVASASVAVLAVCTPAAVAIPPLPPMSEVAPPTAGDSQPPTAETATSNLPDAQATGGQRTTKILAARVGGGRLTFKVSCLGNGRMRVISDGRLREQLGAKRFVCARGKATASFHVGRSVTRQATSKRGLVLRLDLATAGARTQVPVHLRSRVNRAVARPAANSYWQGYPAASCAASRVFVDIQTDFGFGARPGERVFWRPLLWAHVGGSWRWVAHHWESYTVIDSRGTSGGGFVPGTNLWIMGGRGIPTTLSKQFTIGRGIWTRVAVQVWTPGGGYAWNWINSHAYEPVESYGHDYCYFG